MNKTDLLKTIDTIENTVGSLRAVVNDVYREREMLNKDQEENVRIRAQIIAGQRKVLEDLKKVEEERQLFIKRKGALDLERLEIDRLIGANNTKKMEMDEQEKKLDEKMEVAKTLDAWATKLELKQAELKSSETKLNEERAAFAAEKERTRLQSRANDDYRISLEMRDKVLTANQTRIETILNNSWYNFAMDNTQGTSTEPEVTIEDLDDESTETVDPADPNHLLLDFLKKNAIDFSVSVFTDQYAYIEGQGFMFFNKPQLIYKAKVNNAR